MLVHQTQVARVAVLAAIFGTLLIYFLLAAGGWKYAPHALGVSNTDEQTNGLPPGGFSLELVAFWKDFAKSLEDARPQCPPVKAASEDMSTADREWNPLAEKTRPARLDLSEEDEIEITKKHRQMRLVARRLGPSLPIGRGAGIVTTGGLRLFPVLLVSLRMLRRTGCTLPMQVFLGDRNEYAEVADICENVLPTLNARCEVIGDIYSQVDVAPPDHFQFKVLAILFSAFEHVLFLDADAFPAHDPTPLLNSTPYTTHHLVTWGGFYSNTASPHFYHVAGLPTPPVDRGTESGQILLNKRIHRETLLMMVYYNYYGPEYYYPLQSQNGPGQGDKETFSAAALAVRLPFYYVATPPYMLGMHVKGKYNFAGAAQADPMQDWEYGAPYPNHMHEKYEWSEDDGIGASEEGKAKARAFFVHTVSSNAKIHPGKVLREGGKAFEADHADWHRIWGTEDEIVKTFGYDVEARMWECVQEEACTRMEEALCSEVKEFRKKVFG